MDHKFKSLLQNVATRHVIAPVDDIDIKQQLQKLRELDIVNFFVLGSITTIKNVLGMGIQYTQLEINSIK